MFLGVCVKPGAEALPVQAAAESLDFVAFSCGGTLATEGREGLSD